MLQGWRPLDPLINSRRGNLFWRILEPHRPLPVPGEQCKTIGQAQPYSFPNPQNSVALSFRGDVHG